MPELHGWIYDDRAAAQHRRADRHRRCVDGDANKAEGIAFITIWTLHRNRLYSVTLTRGCDMETNRSDSKLRVEWQVVKHAPVSFGIVLLTACLLIGGGFYWHFHTKLDLQTDKIAFLTEENDRLRNEIKRLVKINTLQETALKEIPDTKK